MSAERRRSLPLRPLLLVAIVVGCILAVRASGVADDLTLLELQAIVSDAGPAAIPVYLGVFFAAVALTMPGFPFVVLGILVFGAPMGVPLALVGAGTSATGVTAIYRVIGGKPVGEPKWRIVRRGLELVDKRPVLGVFLLRLVFMISGPANMLLALAGVKPLHNFVGTVLALLPLTLVSALAIDLVVAFLGGS